MSFAEKISWIVIGTVVGIFLYYDFVYTPQVFIKLFGFMYGVGVGMIIGKYYSKRPKL